MSNTITPTVFYRTLNVEGLEIFYREAGPRYAPTVLLSKIGSGSDSRMNNYSPAERARKDLHYRWRLGLAEGETKYDDLEKRLVEAPVISVPAITHESNASGAPYPDPSSYAKKSVGSMNIEPSSAESDATCRRKLQTPLPKPWSMLIAFDRSIKQNLRIEANDNERKKHEDKQTWDRSTSGSIAQ